MSAARKFGTQSRPIELENEGEEDEDLRAVGRKQKPSPPTSTLDPPHTPSGLEIVPYDNSSSVLEPSAAWNTANPKVTAPVSPSIEDLANPRVAESGNHSPGDAGNLGYTEGLDRTLDDDTHGDTLPGATRTFKRLTKGHRGRAGNVKAEDPNGAIVRSSQKTELEREMELFEAAEREEEARLLTSLRNCQSGDCSPKSPISMESTQVDCKRGPAGSLQEQRRPKRGKKTGVNYLALRKEEDVCFYCYDGGELILCDKRSCPKAYHMECTGRESDFFDQKGQWFCGWHFCAECAKSASVQCCTCPNAFCNGCVKEASFLCIRKGFGLCVRCYPLVDMIERNLSVSSEGVEVNFDDEETEEHYFRHYWKDLKGKIDLTWSEICTAYKAKDEGDSPGKGQGSIDSDCAPEKRQSQPLKRKRGATNVAFDEASRTDSEDEEAEEEQEDDDDDEYEEEEDGSLVKRKRGVRKKLQFTGWASKELVDFLNAVNEDATKPLNLLSLNKLVLSYVKLNKLTNTQRRGQIRCDERLQSLLGKKHVGKFEMMRLLNKHIASKRSANAKSSDIMPGGQYKSAVVGNGDDKVQKQQKSRKKSDDPRHLEVDSSKYAAIDVHNISLIYLKRSMLENLQKDFNFESKVKGAFVRIRVPSMVNKFETCYRLVQIVGTKQFRNARNDAKTGDVVLEILNWQRREEITVDLISGQDFTQDECEKLRQSVKLGFLKSMTVGELRERARVLREAKVKDWFDTELLRLTHLRDRASEKGRKKELRECVERLQVLSSPAERDRQLRASIEVNVDSRMDPDYESDNAGNSMKEFQGTPGIGDTGSGKKHWEGRNESLKHPKRHDNGGLAEAALQSETWDTKSKATGWGDQKDSGKDSVGQFSGKPPYANSTGDSILRRGLADDQAPADHHAIGLNHQASFSQKDPADQRATGFDSQGSSLIQKKDDLGEGNGNDDGWGAELECNNQDSGWNGSGGGLQSFDGWGEKGERLKDDTGRGVKTKAGKTGDNSNNDGWGVDVVSIKEDDGWNCRAEGNTKDGGWGAGVGSIKKDNGWNCTSPGMGTDASNQKTETCDPSMGGGMKACGWESNVGTDEKDGWGDLGGDGQKHHGWGADVNRRNDGWRDTGGSGGHNDGWGDVGGASGHIDGWGNNAACESGKGWGNPAQKNEKHATWGAEASRKESNTGGGWGKSGGNRSNVGWGANANGTERKSGWNNSRESFRDAGFDWRDGKPRAETRPPYKDTRGFGRISGGASANTRADDIARTGVNGVGMSTENEKEKVWYYQDPSKTTQGPFSMEQLRKWEKTKLFPLNLKVWRATESQDTSILLTDALVGRFHNDLPPGFDQKLGRGSSAHVPGVNWHDKGGRNNEWVAERGHEGGSGAERPWTEGGSGARSQKPWGHDGGSRARSEKPWGVQERGHEGGSGAGPEKSWGFQEPDNAPPHDGGWEGGRGHWNGEFNRRNPSDHHYPSSRPADGGRFGSARKKNLPCRYFARGMCKKGDECDFMH